MGINLIFFIIIVDLIAFSINTNEIVDRLKKDRMFPNDEGMIILTDKTFQYAEDNYDFLFVFFVADWCGMCTASLNYLKQDLPKLKQEYLNVGFAKIEATFYRKFYLKYKANGYPTILLISKGHNIAEYSGSKSFAAISQWLNERILPSVVPVNSMELFNKIKNSPLNLPTIAYFGYDFNELNALEKYSIENLKRFRFIKIQNQNLINQLNAKPRQVTLFKSFDEPEVSIYGSEQHPLTYEEYENFINTYSHKMIINEERDVQEYIFSQLHSGLIFIYEDKSLPSLLPIIKQTAEQTRDKLQTAGISASESFISKRFHQKLSTTKIPSVVLVNFKHNEPCLIEINDESIIYNETLLIDYVNKWYEGKVDFSKCREIPYEFQKTIKSVNQFQFEKEVLSSKVSVFVKFYAPWCGHCKKLEPVFKKLAKQMEKYSDKIQFVEVDATINEITGTSVTKYPTLLLYKAGRKQSPIKYEGNRSIEDMKRFIKQHIRI